MIDEIVHFSSDRMQLEGVLSYEESLVAPPMVLLCSPHPNLGGDMNNNVIVALAQELSERGYVTLRFNYRGVGGSEGSFKDVAERFHYWESTFGEGNLEGALEDTRSALSFLKTFASSVKTLRLFLAGYSFGAVTAMRLGADDDGVIAIAGIATPVGIYNLNCLSYCKKPKLFICSDCDFATNVEDVRRNFEKFSEPKRLTVKTNVSHFYIGSEKEIAKEVVSFFNEVGPISIRP
ncbi:MAG TPA: alpha/beta hydrolase [Candidatus Hypogeohydataceae bacterium YC40]